MRQLVPRSFFNFFTRKARRCPRLWRDIPEGARLAAIPFAGHLCYAEQPELFNTIVREFLREDHRS